MATEIRLRRKHAHKAEIVRMLDGRLVNLGTKGAFKRLIPETKSTPAYEQLIDEPTKEELVELHNTTNFYEEFDPEVEKALLDKINKTNTVASSTAAPSAKGSKKNS